VTFGIVPEAPETGYGYIQQGAAIAQEGAAGSARQVARFVEKPNRENAEKFLASGDYFWNSGMFLFSCRQFLDELAEFRPDILAACEQALAGGDVSLVLVWVPAKDEPEIRQAFASAMSVRKLSPEARELADRYFFETLVRVHRAGEGQAFTGLKPAGWAPGPGVAAADRAVETGKVEGLAKEFATATEAGVRERYGRLAAQARYKPSDLAAGRAYVHAYVEFLHYVEGLGAAVHGSGHEHQPEAHAGSGDHSH